MSAKKIEILLLEGMPSGMRYIDLKGKNIRGFVAPRTSLKDLLKRPEMKKPGIYILHGQELATGRPLIYVGETEGLDERLPNHKSKDFWTEIIAFVSHDETLDKTAVGYIESNLIKRIENDKLVTVIYDRKPGQKPISEANAIVMDEFIEDIVFQLLVLGYKFMRSAHEPSQHEVPNLFISTKAAQASGRATDAGFLVSKGSTARKELLDSAAPAVIAMREALLNSGVLKDIATHLQFTQDYLFTSPSLAASIICGRSSNGLIEWKTREGKTLKDSQEA